MTKSKSTAIFKKRFFSELSRISVDYFEDYKIVVRELDIELSFNNQKGQFSRPKGFKIIFSGSYPFHPPRVLTSTDRHLFCEACRAVQKHFSNFCVCKGSVLTAENWRASNGIVHVLEDLQKLYANLQNIFNVFWLNQFLRRNFLNLQFSQGNGPDLIPYLV